ncbi:MAG TPA: hypothetical protein VF582_03015 [Allosphingosinicella sp.]
MGQIVVGPDLLIWMLVMGLLVLPVALGSSAGARLLGLSLPSAIPMLIAASMACAASIWLFPLYMSELTPAVNWKGSWPLPAVASTAAVALEALALWRSSRLERTSGT